MCPPIFIYMWFLRRPMFVKLFRHSFIIIEHTLYYNNMSTRTQECTDIKLYDRWPLPPLIKSRNFYLRSRAFPFHFPISLSLQHCPISSFTLSLSIKQWKRKEKTQKREKETRGIALNFKALLSAFIFWHREREFLGTVLITNHLSHSSVSASRIK